MDLILHDLYPLSYPVITGNSTAIHVPAPNTESGIFFAIKHTCHFRLDSECVLHMNCWICMNIYGIVVGVTACEVITLQIERMDVSHGIFYNLMYKLAIVVEI